MLREIKKGASNVFLVKGVIDQTEISFLMRDKKRNKQTNETPGLQRELLELQYIVRSL